MSGNINKSAFNDIAAPILGDKIPEREIKVYPYEFINANKEEAFIMQNTVSLASISQDNLDTADEFLFTDDDNKKYFKMFGAPTSEAKLDVSTATSVYGQELKEEDSFSAISN